MSTAKMSPAKRRPLAAGLAPADCPAKFRNAKAAINPAANAEPEFEEFEIKAPKFEAIDQLNDLSDDASWHDIFYWLKICEELQDSLGESNQNSCRSHEEVKAEFYARWQK